METALLDFLQHEQTGLFKGPYVHVRLPFRAADPAEPIPLDIRPSFTPYVHQLRAFQRLSARDGHAPQPTIITTGTGSGKTECFLYPILDYCLAQRGELGIKAIILYPMNALASDQAQRLARILHRDDRLRGQITAGMYIGGDDGELHRALGPDFLIDDREVLRKHPPDILLTNYKMLDFLLLRPDDKTLWADNMPETLHYLVLDELHTYDGAQGSDVACLIRRLTARLGTPDRFLCPIGTSATVVSDTGDTAAALIDFAAQIFGQTFEAESVIGEERRTLDDFLPDLPTQDDLPTDQEALTERLGETYEAYIARQSQLWFGAPLDQLALTPALRRHSFLRALLVSARDEIVRWDVLLDRLARWDASLAAHPIDVQRAIVQSFLALISHARVPQGDDTRPFLTCQVQLWVREMSRLMREVSAEPRFFWRDDVPAHSERHGLPAYYCRDCGHTGWLTLLRDGDDVLTDDHKKIYDAYFDHHKNVRYVYPVDPQGLENPAGLLPDRICPRCLSVGFHERCPICEQPTLPVKIHKQLSEPRGTQPPRDLQRCPLCGTDGALSIVGSQAASLSSVAISHLYTSPLNDDKKLLAFTDSVQDASHRAAFFGARTYRFNLRTAFQATLVDDTPIRLDTFTDRVLAHWAQVWQRVPHGDQKLAATFMPPDLHDLAAYREFIDGKPGRVPPDLERDLRTRLSWEVLMEYGFAARVGRSLEKSGSSTAYLDADRLRGVVEKLALILPEEIGLLKDLQPDAVRHFVVGLLERTRTRGGVAHPLLRHYAVDQGNWYLLTKKMQPLLSPFHKRSPRFPRFLTDSTEHDVFDVFLTSGTRRTWYTDWAQRALSNYLGTADINEVYRVVIKQLADAGFLQRYPKGNATAYGLDPAALWVTRQTAEMKCAMCGHQQPVAASHVAEWLDRPCLNYQCAGRYLLETRPGQHYYRTVYQRGQVERIFAHEHTGLLGRQAREDVETQFKHQATADSANLLAATSTLEMGIDIGDLSATLACSVPPATANYLQRIGRAGRKTGNSLVLTLANAQPHDLYFFEEPLEMMAGSIVPPGCFLDAPDMLKRQFLAFCMDTWTATETRTGLLPRNVQKMLVGYQQGGFPENLLRYTEQRKATLIERFLMLFGVVISVENQARLRSFVAGTDLPDRVRAALADVEREREDLRAARRIFKDRRDQVLADPAQYQKPQEEIARLEREMNLLVRLIQVLEEKYVLNFFTDAGLLPNYAFPETGVRFKAVITGLDDLRSGGPSYEVKEYLRAAPLAIRELAPFNRFYAEGRKLTVDHVDVGGRDKAVERWQFCDQCAHLELVQASAYRKTCPVCGSPLWSDRGQQHDMVRFRQASAWVDHYESLVGDDADERERQSYQLGRYFDIRPEHSGGAYLLPALPFGLEYLDQVTLREINFGPTDTPGRKLKIADEERPEDGFKICQDCGVAVNLHQDVEAAPPKHTRNCLAKTNQRPPDWHNLYLYREVTSEALRLLLPVSTALVEEKLATFEACLDLGLRRKFRGDPEHLKILPHTEPAPDGTRRRFLIIYDTVPGGTSFLKDLARPDVFFEVLQLALDALRSCRCRLTPEKQACFRCLYSYRTQYDLKLISRQLGIEMLSEILAQQTQLETIPTLSAAHIDSLIESELEQRFVNVLEKYAREKRHSWATVIHNGKRAWELKIGDARWLIEPQVMLDAAQQVSVASKADFVCWPQAGANANLRPVAVFTDGYAYHVCPNEAQSRLADDVRKRRAIIDSGQFVLWSITWDDVKEFEDQTVFPLHLFASQQRHFDSVARESRTPLSAKLMRENAIVQLLEYLAYSDRSAWQQTIFRLTVASLLPPRPPIDAGFLVALAVALQTQPRLPDLSIPAPAPAGHQFYSISEPYDLRLLIHTHEGALRDPQQISVTLRLDDGFDQRVENDFRTAWRQFLLLANLYQFLPGFVPVTTEYVEQFGTLPVEPAITAATGPLSVDWQAAFTYAASSCVDLLRVCQEAQLPAPIVGYELPDAAGRVSATAELAWEDRRVAIFLPDHAIERELFEQAGWRTFESEQPPVVVQALI